MKAMLFFSILMGNLIAHAGDLQWTCRNSDNSIIITQNHWVSLVEESETKSLLLITLKNTSTEQSPLINQNLQFTREENPRDIIVEVFIKNISSRTTLAEDYGRACEANKGPAFHTESYKIEALIKNKSNSIKLVPLFCTETSYWSGGC